MAMRGWLGGSKNASLSNATPVRATPRWVAAATPNGNPYAMQGCRTGNDP